MLSTLERTPGLGQHGKGLLDTRFGPLVIGEADVWGRGGQD